jgi:hypothetical protein
MEHQTPGDASEKCSLNLTVMAVPQPQGGVLIKVRGNHREGVEERQAQSIAWSESLPKMAAVTDPGVRPEQIESLPVSAEPAAPMEVPNKMQWPLSVLGLRRPVKT